MDMEDEGNGTMWELTVRVGLEWAEEGKGEKIGMTEIE